MFTPDFIAFFKELAPNNNKEWFDANRKRYEKEVKEPFKAFVGQLIEACRKINPEIEIEPKDAIFRINRDIRFSKDKTPYKLQTSALVSPRGRKNREAPGIYIQFSPESIRIYSGVYELSTQNLEDLRFFIASNLKEFKSIIQDPHFRKTFGEILGEKSKRIPKELKEAAEKEPLIYNKQLYFFKEYPAETLLRKDLLDFVMEHFKAAQKFNDFVSKAIHY